MDDFCDKLIEELPQIVADEAVCCVRRHLLTETDFASLTQEELTEAFPTMGVRKAVGRVFGKSKHLEDRSAPASGGTSAVIADNRTVRTSASDWARTLELPTVFSPSTMKAIDERKLTRKARVEIVNAVYSRMIAHAEYPTSDQYSTICWRLVEKFDALRDKMGNGIVHIGTWKEQIKQKFRNQRRPHGHDQVEDSLAEGTDGEIMERNKYGRKRCRNNADEQKNSGKKRKNKPGAGIMPDTTVETTHDADELYQQHKDKLSREWGKSAPKQKRIEKLMKKTYTKRREWIVKDVPAAMDIVTEFPMLKDQEYLIQEMLCILGLEKSHDFKTSFFEWCYKVQEYGRLEKRRSGVQDVLVKLDACGSMEDLKGKYCLMLLKLLLAPRSKNSILHEWQDSENFEEQLKKLPSHPAIVVVYSDDNSSILIVVEKKLLCRCSDMMNAVVALIATYFSFDMSFPSGVNSVLIFIQHFMLQLLDEQPIPNAVKIAYSAMEHL